MAALNEKQIAFITCVNDEEEYAECRYYLERLFVPEGYSTDIISIQEAPSMAAGYNAAMKSSDAKYKVYLHQDVFIKNRNFIADLILVFERDKQIGMLGMVGNRILWENIAVLMTWDAGNVADSNTVFHFRFPEKEDGFLEVQMADGLLLATQYDLLWREDIFDGWHFYDLAQCMEFKAAGYKVAVPWQETAWCYHDNSYPNLRSYYDYYRVFAHEYGTRPDFPVEDQKMYESAYQENRKFLQIQEDVLKMVSGFIEKEDRTRIRHLFEDQDFREMQCLQEYKIIVHTDWQEEQNQSFFRLWTPGSSVFQLISKTKALKHALKRIEYGADPDGQERDWILANYSEYAIANVCDCYTAVRDKR